MQDLNLDHFILRNDRLTGIFVKLLKNIAMYDVTRYRQVVCDLLALKTGVRNDSHLLPHQSLAY